MVFIFRNPSYKIRKQAAKSSTLTFRSLESQPQLCPTWLHDPGLVSSSLCSQIPLGEIVLLPPKRTKWDQRLEIALKT